MDPAHCVCSLMSHRAQQTTGPGGHCGMKGAVPDHCSLHPSLPMGGRPSPTSLDFRDRLAVFHWGGLGLDPAPRGTVSSQDNPPRATLQAPPELPPPRGSFRIG